MMSVNDINKSANNKQASSYRIPIPFRFDLIPPLFLRELSEIYEEGVHKYGPAKYIEKPLPWSVIVNHLLNHLFLWMSGDRSEKHLGKVAWGVATLMVYDRMVKLNLMTDKNDLSEYGAEAIKALKLHTQDIEVIDE